MEKQPLISIIVPIFNAEKFIAEAVESVLNQTYPYIELLLVNDGSSDSTRDICREYAEKSEKIIYFEKSNSGVSDTRNFGIEHARGEWIIFLYNHNIPVSSCFVNSCSYILSVRQLSEC